MFAAFCSLLFAQRARSSRMPRFGANTGPSTNVSVGSFVEACTYSVDYPDGNFDIVQAYIDAGNHVDATDGVHRSRRLPPRASRSLSCPPPSLSTSPALPPFARLLPCRIPPPSSSTIIHARLSLPPTHILPLPHTSLTLSFPLSLSYAHSLTHSPTLFGT